MRPAHGNRADSWSESEDALLRDLYPSAIPIADIVAALDRKRTRRGVMQRAHVLNLRRGEHPVRTAARLRRSLDSQQIDVIRMLRCERGLALVAIARKTGHPLNIVRKVCKDNGWKGVGPAAGGRAPRWSPADLKILTDLYMRGAEINEIVAALSRETTEDAVHAKVRDLKLLRPRSRPGPKIKPGHKRDGLADEAPQRPARTFSVVETRRICRFFARGDSLADVARQMRCDVDDVEQFDLRG